MFFVRVFVNPESFFCQFLARPAWKGDNFFIGKFGSKKVSPSFKNGSDFGNQKNAGSIKTVRMIDVRISFIISNIL